MLRKIFLISLGIISSLLVVFSVSIVHAQPRCISWQPPNTAVQQLVDQPIEQLEEILKSLSAQQSLNYTIANISFLYDAKLYILFNRHLEKIPEQNQLSSVNEQNQWLATRAKAIAKAYDAYKGGSIAPYNSGVVKVDLTKKRIKYIEKLMAERQ